MRDVQSSVLRMLHAYGIPADIVEEYDCVPIRIRRVGDTVKLQTMFGARAVKAVTEPLANVKNAFAVSEYLAGKGIARVPRFIRNRYGDPFVRDGDRFYYMTDWIGGRALEVRHREHMVRAVEELAQWHINARGGLYQDGAGTPDQPYIDKLQRLYNKTASFWQDIRGKTNRTEFERMFIGFAQDVLLRTQEAVDRLSAVDFNTYEEQMNADGWVCHGNFSAAHIRYDGEFYALVDYDNVHAGTPLSDLVYFMSSHMNEHNWSADLVEELVTTYLKRVGEEHWRIYASAMLRAPLDILQLVEAYQTQDFKDEGVYTDLLEQSLELVEAKDAALERMAQQEPVLSMEDLQIQDDTDEVVHADLPTNTNELSQVGAEAAKLQRQSDKEPNAQTLRKSKLQATRKQQQETDQIIVRKYRPKPAKRARIQGPGSGPNRRVQLWGDAQHPGD